MNLVKVKVSLVGTNNLIVIIFFKLREQGVYAQVC
jgi:hypothetical protein